MIKRIIGDREQNRDGGRHMARDQLPAVIEPADDTEAMPALVADAGGGRGSHGRDLSGEIRNPHTRRAYPHAVRQFLEGRWPGASWL